MVDAIILSKDEAISILKALSRIDGFLLGIKDTYAAAELMEYPVDLITAKLIGEEHVSK